MTIQQAADFIIGTQPGSIVAVDGGGATAVVGRTMNKALVFDAKTRSGAPLVGATVTLSSPTSGPALIGGDATGTTDSNGRVTFTPAANGVVGSFTATATIVGTSFSAGVALSNTQGAPHAVTLVSGGGQSAAAGTAYAQPVVVKVTDFFGNAVSGASVFFSCITSTVFPLGLTTTGADGTAQAGPWAPTNPASSVACAAELRGSVTYAQFTLNVL
jgi:hypothetical protein